MNGKFPGYFVFIFFLFPQLSFSQPLTVNDPFLQIKATAQSPLYTTYTAAMERSRLYGDKGYTMDYFSDCNPLCFEGDQAGRLYHTWRFNAVVVDKIGKYYKKPVVTASFPDMVMLTYEPWPGIEVQQAFLVYSSTLAVVDVVVKNAGRLDMTTDLYPVLELPHDSLQIVGFDAGRNGFVLNHYETRKRLISNLNEKYPYPTRIRDFLGLEEKAYSYGGYQGGIDDFYNEVKRDFYAETKRRDSLNGRSSGYVDYVALHSRFTLKPGESRHIRYYRGWQGREEKAEDMYMQIEKLKDKSLQSFIDADVSLFNRVPRLSFSNEEEKLVYLGAFNLARGCMLPPADKTRFNFYVFSRQPLWGWGHGHQVLHESLSMLSYVYLDPLSAENSQRVYIEQQGSDGLIAYRHGPRGAQTYPHKDEPTTSAPFFSWINWEVYKVSKDRPFLEEAYNSGTRYIDWLYKHRDTDHDGTFEWGPYGIIENVRDWYNAVFQVSAERYLDVDKEDISDELECLDLSLMVVKELKCLSAMAGELGKEKESTEWKQKADTLSKLINDRMWDPETQFYYSVNKKDHSFKFMSRDLRRQEIIGLLALWAGVATPERAEILRKAVTDTSRFRRKYGVPTLSAKDEWFSPYVDYCCKWNGPVWLLWDYMVFDGLKSYGYNKEAGELAQKMIRCVSTQLSRNHHFWESYSPDNDVLNCPPNYIWDSIMAKLLIEMKQ
ncbi:MAG: trehalase family glycosidase [Bacteroidetes bacterium]|nr:trehalase family glycosidase [Bacteroidota bacterium]